MPDLTHLISPGLERNPQIAEFRVGDSVRVHLRIVEQDPEKKRTTERVQPFEGVVIRRRRAGSSSNFTVRRVTHGVGVERTFLLSSPRLEKVEMLRRGKVRRARLYYLRGLSGKSARIKETPRQRS